MHNLLINKLDLKQQRYGLVYEITSMYIYLLKEKERISVNNTAAAAADPIIEINKKYLKMMHHLLTA